MREPTARQIEVLRFIADGIRSNGYPPTFRELAAGFGWASAYAASDHLRALTRKGLINLERGRHARSRCIRLTPKGWLTVGALSTPGILLLPLRCTVCDCVTFAPHTHFPVEVRCG